MGKIKSLLVSCVSLLSVMTISAQTLSFMPNWKPGDKVSYCFVQKEIKKSGTESATV